MRCGGINVSHRDFCEKCGNRLLSSTSSSNRKEKTTVVIILVLLGIIMAAALYDGKEKTGLSSTGSQNTAGTKSSGIQVGDTKLIRVGAKSKNSLAVFKDKGALDEFLNAMDSNDTERLLTLYAAGRHFEVPENTRVKVIDTGFFRSKLEVYKVSILEGTYSGLAGWVMDIDLK